MTVGQNIKNLRIERGLTQEELGNIVGVKRAAVQKWESGRVCNLKRSTIQKLSEYFSVVPSFFIDASAKREYPTPNVTNDYTAFPVLGEIAAGYDNIAVEDWDGEVIEIPKSYLRGHKKDEFFVLCVKGDSMYPEYHEGDKVLILRQNALDFSGQIGAVIYGDEFATLKKVEFSPGEDWLNLVPINPMHPPKKIEKAGLEHCHIIGVPKMLIREF